MTVHTNGAVGDSLGRRIAEGTWWRGMHHLALAQRHGRHDPCPPFLPHAFAGRPDYAAAVMHVLDPDGKYFGSRVVAQGGDCLKTLEEEVGLSGVGPDGGSSEAAGRAGVVAAWVGFQGLQELPVL